MKKAIQIMLLAMLFSFAILNFGFGQGAGICYLNGAPAISNPNASGYCEWAWDYTNEVLYRYDRSESAWKVFPQAQEIPLSPALTINGASVSNVYVAIDSLRRFTDKNFANTNLTFTAARTHTGNSQNFTASGFNTLIWGGTTAIFAGTTQTDIGASAGTSNILGSTLVVGNSSGANTTLKLKTPNVRGGTATTSQYLKLNNTDGTVEFADAPGGGVTIGGEYANDSAAGTGGISIGNYYVLNGSNTYGLPHGSVKKRIN